jgi:imidazolonepropionase-like amidohydrolase
MGGPGVRCPDVFEMAESVMVAAVEEAHARHKPVVAHDLSRGGVQAAIRSGVDGLVHAAFLDSVTIMQLKRRGMFLIPTLASLVDTTQVGRGLVEAVGLAYRAGVRIVFGTDGGVLPHGGNAEEFLAMTRAGIRPLDAIRAATVNAAAAWRIGDSVGVIAPGMAADIIAVRGDPLTDLAVLQHVRFVMISGRIASAAR